MKSNLSLNRLLAVSVVACVCTLGAAIPAQAHAPAAPADQTAPAVPGERNEPPSEAATVVAQGTDGTVAWTKTDAGIVTFGPGTFGPKPAAPNIRNWQDGVAVTKIIFTEPATTILPADSSELFALSDLTEIEGIGQVNTSGVTSMNHMFYGASALTTLNISGWNPSNVTSMYAMFAYARALTTLNISEWDTGSVEDMNSLFLGTNALTTLNINNWNTENVTDMSSMFTGIAVHTLDLRSWNTSNLTNMASMFGSASALATLNLSNWNTSNVTDMTHVFGGSDNLATLHLGPNTVLSNNTRLGNPAGLTWHKVDSTDPATLNVLNEIGTGSDLATATTGLGWQGGIFMATAPIAFELDENIPAVVGGTSQRVDLNQYTAQALRIPAQLFTINGYALTGWNTAADGTGTTYTNGATTLPTAGTVLYAQWAQNPAPDNGNGTITSLPHTGNNTPLAGILTAIGAIGAGTALLAARRNHKQQN